MSSWLHLWQALLLGCLLGLIYGALQFLRPRWFSDLLFLFALFTVWAQLVFGLCDGDLRFAYSAALLLGIPLWYFTIGSWLRPVFSLFRDGLFRIFRLILLPFKKTWKKIRKMQNFFFATGKKWVTIKCKKSVRHRK